MDRRTTLALIGAFALAGAILGVARWELEPRHHAGDTFWYARNALLITGRSEAEANMAAAELMGRRENKPPDGWIEIAETIDPRYPGIFSSRPTYPVVVASLMTVLDLRTAMIAGALAAGMAFAAVFGWFVRWVTGSTAAALLGLLLAFSLPSGRWFAFMIADGWMLALWTATLALATRYLLAGGRAWLGASALMLVVLYVTKAANGATIVAAAVPVAGVLILARADRARRALDLAATFTLIGVAQLAVFAVLGLPGLETTLQDLFTGHFSRPDTDNLLGRLLERNMAYMPGLLESLVFESNTLYVLVPLLLPLAVARRWWTAMWLVAGVAAVLTVLLHPVVSEIPRLMAPVWISASLGGAVAAAWMVREVLKRRSACATCRRS